MCRDKLVYDIGTIKLADFGLSKSLPYNKHAQYDLDETFKLTGETGSYRYMVRAHIHRWLWVEQSNLHHDLRCSITLWRTQAPRGVCSIFDACRHSVEGPASAAGT